MSPSNIPIFTTILAMSRDVETVDLRRFAHRWRRRAKSAVIRSTMLASNAFPLSSRPVPVSIWTMLYLYLRLDLRILGWARQLTDQRPAAVANEARKKSYTKSPTTSRSTGLVKFLVVEVDQAKFIGEGGSAAPGKGEEEEAAGAGAGASRFGARSATSHHAVALVEERTTLAFEQEMVATALRRHQREEAHRHLEEEQEEGPPPVEQTNPMLPPRRGRVPAPAPAVHTPTIAFTLRPDSASGPATPASPFLTAAETPDRHCRSRSNHCRQVQFLPTL
ncbi:hypothetical protein CONLIGDRAFT_686760 [Coniochaeta ligniaria NRRL 30616]|uniref:Uncharacterized protein n=1 Tax=Coniochaeta ligniaria NRRL 30616 TaxID=1408157 RepID=A0A1J7IQD7_9PEZI|nr:hypothetical protein CONLIGDRAFT_686760 [Coniochaeta ligniaria NRRL 30616]